MGIIPHFSYVATSYNGAVTASYKSPAILRGSASNQLIINNTESSANTAQSFKVLISRHTVEEVAGVGYIRGSRDGFDAEAIESYFSLAGGETFTMNFEGSNTESLATGYTFKTVRAAGEGADGFDEAEIDSRLFTINRL